MTVVALVAYIAALVSTTADLLITPGAPARKTD